MSDSEWLVASREYCPGYQVQVFVFHVSLFYFQMRHLFLIIDMSEAMGDQDLKPTRLLSTLKVRTDNLVEMGYILIKHIDINVFHDI